MNLDTKSKMKKYILSLIIAVLILFMGIVIIAIKGLNETRANTAIANDIAVRRYHLQSMQLSFERMQRFSSNLLVYAGDFERIDNIAAEMFSIRNSFDNSLYAFTDIELLYQTHIENAKEQENANHVSYLIANYNETLLEISELARVNDVEAMNALWTEAAPLVSEITQLFYEMSDYTQAQSDEFAAYSAHGGNRSVMSLISVSVGALIIILLFSTAIFFALTKALTPSSDIQYTTPYSQELYKSSYTKGDDHLITELGRCITDLKSVTYDLSKAAKELKN